MHCPRCQRHENVIYKTISHDGGLVERYRKCKCCGQKFVTYESIIDIRIIETKEVYLT